MNVFSDRFNHELCSEYERKEIVEWISGAMDGQDLDLHSLLSGQILYRNNRSFVLKAGSWHFSYPRPHEVGEIGTIFLARSDQGTTLDTQSVGFLSQEKVTILLLLASRFGLMDDPDITRSASRAIAKILTKTYGDVTETMAISKMGIVMRIAFSEQAGEVAAEIDGEWIKPSGEPVTLGEDWIIVDWISDEKEKVEPDEPEEERELTPEGAEEVELDI